MGPVVIGIGNPLRQDDGLGWRAAELLGARLAPGAADIHFCHQLTPEFAAKLGGAPLAIFLDASVDQAPGEARQHSIQPDGQFTNSHHLTPQKLLSLTRDVYGTAPPAVLISGGVFETNLTDGLTEGAEYCAARMADLAASALARSAA